MALVTIGSWLFVAFTAVLVTVTFYFPIYGLGMALNSSIPASDRWKGVLLLIPSIVLLLWLLGMAPVLRGNALLWFGLGVNLLLLPSVVACLRLGFPAALGAVAAFAYSGVWWLLVKARISRG